MITLIICTRNRAGPLNSALQAIVNIDKPRHMEWDMIIVDNGSTDDTQNIINKYSNLLPIKSIYENSAGLSNARNRGVTEAQGDYIVWTDDDTVPDQGWLLAYENAFICHPEAILFGGPILPIFVGKPPKWFTTENYWVASSVAFRNLGKTEILLDSSSHKIPYGANYAVKTIEQKNVLYSPELGVSPNQKRLGEEIVVFQKLLQQGHGYWIPAAKLKHIIPPQRQTARYLFKYYISAGETWAFLSTTTENNPMGQNLNKNTLCIFKIPLIVIYKSIIHGSRIFLSWTFSHPDRWIYDISRFGFYFGAAQYWHKHGYTSYKT